MKTSEAFQIWTKCVENKWEGNRVPLCERELDCTLTKEPQNYISHFFVIWGYHSQNSNLIKDRNIIYPVSKRYLNIL